MINAILYVGVLFIYWVGTKRITIGTFLLIIWSISAVGAIWYEPNNFIGHLHKIQLWPFFYMFALNLIVFFPFLKFRHDQSMYIYANTMVLIRLCLFIGFLSVLPLCENIVRALTYSSDSGMHELYELFEDRYTSDYDPLSYLSTYARYCTRLLGFIGTNLTTFLLVIFPLFFNIKNNKLAFTGIIIANLNFFIQSMNIFARFAIAVQVVMLLSGFIIVYYFYAIELRKKISKYFFLLLSLMLVSFVTVSIYRLEGRNNNNNENDVNMVLYIGQYLCEGMTNFSADRSRATIFDRREELEIAIRKSLLREKEITKYRTKTDGYRGELTGPNFSTWIGNFYLALNPIGTIFFFFLSSFFIYRFTKKNIILSFAQCYLLIAYLRMMILGICYNTYAVGADEFVGELFLIPFMFLTERKDGYNMTIVQNKNFEGSLCSFYHP